MTNSRASGTSLWTKIEDHEATGTASTKTFTFGDIADTYSKLLLEIDIIPTAAMALQMTINGLSASMYSSGVYHSSSTQSALSSANAAFFVLASTNMLTTADTSTHVSIDINYNNDSPTKQFTAVSHALTSTEQAHETTSHFINVDLTSFTSITIQTSTSTWKAGTKMTLYGLKR